MGFADIMKDGSYAQVRHIVYDKIEQTVAFSLDIFHTNAKEEVFATLQFNLYMSQTVPTVIAKQNKPPVDPKDGDMYAVGAIPTGAWSEYKENTLVKWRNLSDASWDWTVENLELIYLEANGKYYRLVNESLVVKETTVDSHTWDTFFSSDKIGALNNSDIIKQCYEYLKIRSEFVNAVDV